MRKLVPKDAAGHEHEGFVELHGDVDDRIGRLVWVHAHEQRRCSHKGFVLRDLQERGRVEQVEFLLGVYMLGLVGLGVAELSTNVTNLGHELGCKLVLVLVELLHELELRLRELHRPLSIHKQPAFKQMSSRLHE